MDQNPHRAFAYDEFHDLRLVALYDTLNPIAADTTRFFLEMAEPSTRSIIDIGCGTGALTCALAKHRHTVTGLDPSGAMLDIARRRSHGSLVRWTQGEAQTLAEVQMDLAIMTSHVAQFLLDDEDWQATLAAIHKTLTPGGHFVFDSRNPLTQPWDAWTKQSSLQHFDTDEGPIDMWYQFCEITRNRVRYEIHYSFAKSGEKLVSANELVYRSQDAIEQSLIDAGFRIEHVFGDWDRRRVEATSPELIFVAARP
ncbi:MAG: class I SAM-dependent methyltransferase [Rhodobiaceae bacterium]|nr:class I SAM-dependent methyltransferase [Rhodobiaceae bacterium]